MISTNRLSLARSGVVAGVRVFGEAAPKSYPESYLRPSGPAAAWRRAQKTTKTHAVKLALVPLLLMAVTFRAQDSGAAFDAQVAARLVGYSLAAVAVLVALGRNSYRLNAHIALWALLPIWLGVTAAYAPDPLFAATAGICNLIVLLFCWWFVQRYGPERSVAVLMGGGAVVCFLSAIAFYGYPELGRTLPDYLTGDPGGRMRGVAGAANALGSIAASTLLASVIFFPRFTRAQRRVAILAIALSAIALLASESRSSMLAAVVGIAVWRFFRGGTAVNIITVLALALVACAVVVMSPDIMSLVTREGRADDLATFNGRALIWSVAWEHIVRHPVSGFGFGASRLFLSSDDRLFAGAVHCHDLYLELLFSGGAIALGLFGGAFVVTVVRALRQKRAEGLALLLFFAVLGVTEATPFAGLPQFQSFAFYTAISICLARTRLVRRRLRVSGQVAAAPQAATA